MPLVVNFKWRIEIGQCSICLLVNILILFYLLPYQGFFNKKSKFEKILQDGSRACLIV
jgi:hypothetical protein